MQTSTSFPCPLLPPPHRDARSRATISRSPCMPPQELIEFTLIEAYLNAATLDEACESLATRRAGASGVPVAGAAAFR